MRARRRQLCLRAPPSQPAVLATSSRLLGLCAAVVAALVLLSSPGGGQTRDPQQAALDDFVAARTLTDKCPTWQIDFAEVRGRFARLNLQPADLQGAGVTPASSTSAYPTIAASCLACHR
jgi:hypothetical protein